jgi:hypothetical protein
MGTYSPSKSTSSSDILEALDTADLTPAEREVAELLSQNEYAIATLNNATRLRTLAIGVLGEGGVSSEFRQFPTENWRALTRLQIEIQQRVLGKLGLESDDFPGIEILMRP